jgi:hypothetical protein
MAVILVGILTIKPLIKGLLGKQAGRQTQARAGSPTSVI